VNRIILGESRGWCTAALVMALLQSIPTRANAAVEISSKPTQNVTCNSGVCSATAKKAVLNAADLDGMLSSGDVTVSSGSLAQDIDIKAKLSWSTTSRLTLDAYRSIAFEKPVTVLSNGGLTIVTNDGSTNGDFTFMGKGRVEFKDTTSSLMINGQAYFLFSSLKMFKQYTHNPGGYIALAKNINLSRHDLTKAPVENLDGVLEGLGNTISGLTIDDTHNGDFVGLIGDFGGTAPQDIIRDIGLTSVNIHATGGCVGTLAGAMDNGIITHAYVTGSIALTNEDGINAGGLVCGNAGSISQTHAAVTITVSGVAGGAVGGLVGLNQGACFQSTCLGTIDESYSTGAITGVNGTMAGGLVGENTGGAISNSYATGAVGSGSNGFAGGLIGSNENNVDERTDPVLSDVYSTGAVTGGTGSTIGGLVGQDIADPGITDAYWDLDTSGIANPAQGAGNVANDPGITGLSTTQFQSGLPAGFKQSIWKQNGAINGGYPYLSDLPPN